MGVARLLVAVAAQDLPMTSVNCNKMPESVIAVAAVVLALFVPALWFVYKWFYGSTEQYECQSLKPEMAKKKSIVAIDCEMVRCLPTKKWQIKARKTRKRNKKEVAVAAHCAVVDYNGRVVYDEYICPPM